MLPPLRNGLSSLSGALEQAQAQYDEGTGDVTQIDLNKLQYGVAELQKYLIIAEEGESLALAALKHTMGLPMESELAQADTRLTHPAEVSLPTLASFLVEASERRPEWAQIEHGKKASLALADAERLANAPVLFLGGEFEYNWTPMRDDVRNPYVYDPYNEVNGGVALGLQFDLNPWAAKAKTKQAEAMHDQVLALQQFAKTGIPLQVKKAYDETRYWLRIAQAADQGSRATQKWMVFAFAAFKTGTGEARDVIEGLVAHLQARRGYFEAVLNHRLAYAELEYAVGRPSAASRQ
jgi:outer membrane protein TolC